VLNYSVPLPFGKGQRWLSDAGNGLNRLVGGWRFNGITSFQSGFPLAFTAVGNDLANSFGAGTIRPNRAAGCSVQESGSAVARLGEWFNTSCFSQPATPFSFGNEPRVDPGLRGEGVDNWDLALTKDTPITDQLHMKFEAQFLNAFNRVQFGPPGLQVGGTNFGQVTSTLNNPRQIQFSLRITY
jgi:hypothetical protein